MDHHTMCPHCGQLIGATPPPPTETCPECFGRGYTIDWHRGLQTAGYLQRHCSRGCPTAYTVNYGMAER